MLANLRALFGVIVDIVLLRRGPESLPASTPLLAGTVLAYLGLSALMVSQWQTPPDKWALQLVVGVGVTLLCFNTAFLLFRKRERFVQTMTAIFAAGALFAPLLVPVLGVVLPALQNPDKTAAPPFAMSILGSILGLWLFAVQVRCVRAAFEWPWGGAIVFMIGQELLGSIIFLILFAAPAAAG